ncbi:hydroxyacylglutathione hydrolase [Sphingorhabdus lutea]|uniref:Hydroxyacylglutathione hydrolase n=1 Tax=Sphingorhabdus lutea TaxID=1913578 RepID=A0A1L3JDZ9_9SPHN|nr:hydroxyacylglutathione hydrolase [Sphingorhabdus lutea]APG63352.1 hydroxyacylglutathione hydrolase [Sphingorhabdus lutea]
MLEIIRIPAFDDNYIWMVHDDESRETIVVDPGDAAPVLAEAEKRGWTINQIWNTHWHGDHIGGNAAIKAATGCKISGPKAEADKISTLDVLLSEGDEVQIGTHKAQVIDVPAHTAGHIAFYMADDKAAFVGDTLFAMGCGRLFEGTAAQMHDNMQKLSNLPDDVAVYCAHEYTLSNAKFAITVEPENAALITRLADVESARANNIPTIPTNIGLEKATNPFMRAISAEKLAEIRTAKDNF